MAQIYVDRTDDGQISVRIYAGVSKPKTKLFHDRDQAVAFAESKMGRTGMVLDTTLMTAEQLAQQKARQERSEAIIAEANENKE